MTLPTSGAISLGQVNTELGKAATAAISMNNADVRTLEAKPSGIIAMSDLHGKSSVAPPTLSLSVTGNNQIAGPGYTVYTYINCTLGGTETTTSGVRISGTTIFSFTKMSNTQYRVGHVGNETGDTYTATYRITATNSTGSVTRDATITLKSLYSDGNSG